MTQYRILKFVAVNVGETQMLLKPLRDIRLGTYENLQVGTMETPVIDVIHKMVEHNISSVPILSEDGWKHGPPLGRLKLIRGQALYSTFSKRSTLSR